VNLTLDSDSVAARSTTAIWGFSFRSLRNMIKATMIVTIDMTSQIGTLASMMSVEPTPAALAVIDGAPWMKKSLDRPIPWPNRFIATAAQIAGSPALRAKGKSRAPTRATAGEGQINQEATSMTAPTMKKATLLERMAFFKGRIISSSAPMVARVRVMETTSAMTTMMPRNSPPATTRAL